MRGHLTGADRADGREPQDHHRPEHAPDDGGARALDGEQDGQDRERERHGEVRKARRGDLEPLDGGEHGDGGRDDAVAVEQRRAEDAERDEQRAAGGDAGRRRCTSAVRARMPPSPWLSARMTKAMYLTDTISVIAQKTSETTP